MAKYDTAFFQHLQCNSWETHICIFMKCITGFKHKYLLLVVREMFIWAAFPVEVEGTRIIAQIPCSISWPWFWVARASAASLPSISAATEPLDEGELHGFWSLWARLGALKVGNRLSREQSFCQSCVKAACHSRTFPWLIQESHLNRKMLKNKKLNPKARLKVHLYSVDNQRWLCGGNSPAMSLVVRIELLKRL